jgi:hypothetical protein
MEFAGRVLTVREVVPFREGTVVSCIPSFVPETGTSEEARHTVVPYLTHESKLYPGDLPANITFEGLVDTTSRTMACPCMLRTTPVSQFVRTIVSSLRQSKRSIWSR